ncbi:glycosyl hydrolase family 95 catalytic domain-containing protein [Actinacidiphila yeochonensis]|uniref:glycosyl hydrolase family 95 catalytic domain-containing protein n=1 Tax=Actinacidiphila yeochonensis TaxID=89050 RepID=UPI00068CDB63|nr:glycoside hydrolase N-terminal domain-containing protein [Actinacidiphila yeochonensis]
MHTLRYRRPADQWTEALPIGNGLQGAMLYGIPGAERVLLNDGAAWSGGPGNEALPPVVSAERARAALADARAALGRGDGPAADAAVRRLQHRWSQTFLPFAEVGVRVEVPGTSGANGPFEGYERVLDLDAATHTVRYRHGGTAVTAASFASHPDRVLVHRVTASGPVDVTLALTSPLRVLGGFGTGTDDRAPAEAGLLLQLPSDVAPPFQGAPETLRWDGREGAALRGAVVVGVAHDGLAAPGTEPGTVVLRGATRVAAVIATATTFEGVGLPPRGDEHAASARARERVRTALASGPDEVRRRQLADHRALYRRVSWQPADPAGPLPTDGTPPTDTTLPTDTTIPTVEALPTDERLTRANAAGDALAADPALAPLLFHYGRYLLISCSRRGGTPANLQGIWNGEMRPPWSSNYTANINLQMNYWAADTADLPEVLPPLVDLVGALSRTGARTARRLYGARGWVAHHNTDVWAYSQPVGAGNDDPKWAFWPFAGAWLVGQLQDHLSFGGRSAADPEAFARETVWPLARSAAEFLLDWLVPEGEEDGRLGTAPSTSPENSYLTADGRTASVARSSAMDLALSAELLSDLVALAGRLGLAGDEVAARAARALPRLPGPRQGRDGALVEWADDPAADDPHHRHQSHLHPVFPGRTELPEEVLRGAARSLDLRGDESTGWSLAWRLALRARLRQPDAVGRLLALLFRDMATERGPWSGGLYPNLFAAHPPFQIDANLGYVAAVAECLVQSHLGRIELLPSVPARFAPARVTGLVARPGVRVDVEWREGGSDGAELVSVRLSALHAGADGPHTVVYRGA